MMLDDELKSKLADITKIFEKKIELVVIKGEKSEETQDMIEMVQDIASTSEKISVKIFEKESLELKDKGINLEKLPAVVILDENGEFSRIKYTAVPTGQELNSFILAMYNVAGPGQKINESIIERIKKIDKKLDLKIGISLDCHRCAETVQSCQRIVVENKNISLEAIDVFSHKDFKIKYDLVNVPAIIINDSKMFFGQLSIEEVVDILETL